MEEIRFKPSIRIDMFVLLFIGLPLFIGSSLIVFNYNIDPTFIFYIFFFLIIGPLGLIVRKLFTTYLYSDNEIENLYQFISKQSQVYRIDQITSIELRRNFFEKIFGLGSINFGIFGGSNLTTNNQGNKISAYSLKSLTNYDEIFKKLSEDLNIVGENEVYKDKPSLKPINFFIFLYIFLGLISFSISYFLFSNSEGNFLTILSFIFSTGFGVIFLILFLISSIKKLQLKSTKFLINEKYVQNYYDYIFGKKDLRAPIIKITNTDTNKNLISYGLFKVGLVKIYTGGSHDPLFNNLNDFEIFYNSLNSIVKTGYVKKLDEKVGNNLEESNEDPSYQTKPGSSFIITYMFYVSIVFLSILIYIYTFLKEFFNLSILIIGSIFFILLILRVILWSNTKYEFFDNKINVTTGILDITKKEAYYKNVKHVRLRRGLLFDRILKQGTISIYTPGTIFDDKKIYSIKNYKEVYKNLKNVLLE